MKIITIILLFLLTVFDNLFANDQWISIDRVKIMLGTSFDNISGRLGSYESRSYVTKGGDGIRWSDFYEYRYSNNNLIIWVSKKSNAIISVFCIGNKKKVLDSNGVKSGDLFSSVIIKMKPYYLTGDSNYILVRKQDTKLGEVEFSYSSNDENMVGTWWIIIKNPPIGK